MWPITLGLSQGSGLGSLLFNVYTKDTTELGTGSFLFADDAIFYNINQDMLSSIRTKKHFISVQHRYFEIINGMDVLPSGFLT